MGLPFAFNVKKAVRELTEKSNLVNICQTKGVHTSSGKGAIVSRLGNVRVYDTCKICHLSYERKATAKELETYNRIMNTEFII